MPWTAAFPDQECSISLYQKPTASLLPDHPSQEGLSHPCSFMGSPCPQERLYVSGWDIPRDPHITHGVNISFDSFNPPSKEQEDGTLQ